MVRGDPIEGGRATIARILQRRVLLAWMAYVADMQRRTGRPMPDIAIV